MTAKKGPQSIRINRAPVLTLWAAIVAERLGFARDEALTLGRAVAGLDAYSKGKSLGLFKPAPEEVRRERERLEHGLRVHVDLMHRAVPAEVTPSGLRALSKGKQMNPESVQRYLEGKFGDALGAVEDAMQGLARSIPVDELAQRAYALYEEFRPTVPAGVGGWGAAGELNPRQIRDAGR